jgi:hypothetical protein
LRLRAGCGPSVAVTRPIRAGQELSGVAGAAPSFSCAPGCSERQLFGKPNRWVELPLLGRLLTDWAVLPVLTQICDRACSQSRRGSPRRGMRASSRADGTGDCAVRLTASESAVEAGE